MKKKLLSIKIITLFPQFIQDFVENFGIVRRAQQLRLLDIVPINLRKFGPDKRGTVDGRPYGGGAGMVLRADVLFRAICSISSKFETRNSKQISNPKFQIKSQSSKAKIKQRIILLTPQGKRLEQADAKRLAKYDELILICGRYEGFDERIRKFVDEELSIGDYVLMGGELPALVVAEAVMRLRNGILGKDESSVQESFNGGVLEYPQYTKPEVLEVRSNKHQVSSKRQLRVPKILLTGHHANIENWRKQEAIKRTKKRRPDLVAQS